MNRYQPRIPTSSSLGVCQNDSAVSIYLNPVKDKEGKIEGWQSVQIDWFYLRGMVSVIGCYFKRLFTLGAFKFNWEVQ